MKFEIKKKIIQNKVGCIKYKERNLLSQENYKIFIGLGSNFKIQITTSTKYSNQLIKGAFITPYNAFLILFFLK